MISQITQCVWEHIDALPANPVSDDTMLCTTIDGNTTREWKSFWIQLHAGQINFKHIDDSRRDKILGAIVDEIETTEDATLEPGTYMTFDVSHMSQQVMDGLLERLLREYFEVSDENGIRISTEEL